MEYCRKVQLKPNKVIEDVDSKVIINVPTENSTITKVKKNVIYKLRTKRKPVDLKNKKKFNWEYVE